MKAKLSSLARGTLTRSRFYILLAITSGCIYMYVHMRQIMKEQKLIIDSTQLSPRLEQGRHFSMLKWWENINAQKNIKLPPHLTSFQSTLKLEDQKNMRKLFFKVTDLFNANNISYHLQAGTLVGAVRHGGIIPWDDDFDIYVNHQDVPAIEAIFKKDKPIKMDNFELCWMDYKHKFYKIYFAYQWTNSTHKTKHGHWPFVDVFVYKVSGSMLVDVSTALVILEANRVFPLRQLNFEGRAQPVPRDIPYVIKTDLKTDALSECCSAQKHFNKVADLKPTCVPCSQLYPYYPFIRRSLTGHDVVVVNTSLLWGQL